MPQSDFDIAIIGGGVIGGMTALFLRQQGMNVAVLEKNSQLAIEASRAGGGIISPLHPWRYSQAMLDLATWSHQQFPAITRQLSAWSGINVPLLKTGMLIPNTEEADAAINCSFLNSRVVSAAEIRDIEPGLGQATRSVFIDQVCNVRNPAMCQALPIAISKWGIEAITDCLIEKIESHESGFSIHSNQKKIHAGKIVVCAGAWSSEVLSLFGLPLITQTMPEIFPVKGQMLAFKAKPGVLRAVILEKHRYLIPRHDGIVVVGSTVEHQGFDKRITNEAKVDLIEFAHAMLPALRYCPVISHWSGLRPGSHRDRPIICEVEQTKGLYLNVGHFRNGLLSAPASAQVLTDIILKKTSNFDLPEYAI